MGLKAAGFNVTAAVEMDSHAADTYTANHPEVDLMRKDIRDVLPMDLLDNNGDPPDLISGCPPCQGFTSLTAKYRREDPRNALIKEMGRLIAGVRPKAVMLENVPGLESRGSKMLDDFLSTLDCAGYVVRKRVLQVANYGVPQRRRRLVLLAGRGFPIELPAITHSRTGEDGLPRWKSLKDAIGDVKSPMTLAEAQSQGGPSAAGWNIVGNITELSKERYRSTSPGDPRYKLPEKLRPECHKSEGKGFSNVYGRMSWDAPSPTITGGFMTPSKGRFGHPSEIRTISVHEAALIQTFPEDYSFPVEHVQDVCSIIGNALPCDFATVVAARCADAMASFAENGVDD